MPKKCFVTGASGFLGSNLVHELLGRGHEVKGFVRENSDLRGLEASDCQLVTGSLANTEALKAGLSGCDWVFHVAASYRLWLPDYAPMYEANVEGTRNLITVASAAGCEKVLYTSTVGCIGLPTRKNGFAPTDENSPLVERQLTNHYKRSKWQAELMARQMADEGHPVVIVNPSTPIGPRDAKPTPTGKMIVDFLNRQMPAYLDTGLNWVHVRDVALGHILAAEKGRIGERYILGNQEGNLTMLEALQVLAEITGLSAPRMRVPYSVAWAAAVVNEGIAKLTKRPPKAPLGGVRMAKYKMWFDPSKAVRELGMPQTPVRTAFADAVDWFCENGYARISEIKRP
ncbi:MAG: N-acetyl-alpha-D-glucosaminyl-diphospho-ditrans,octacis-undecaprenol 4-epimerase [Verrucomicrobia subdivision 3 bacterium]|nr:N-acetyl-alpha-D-glucosaminyl-diphospho-ditrans,octacis-undecaprenol 4-epimerase [Limisphaerales bacterium]MCS1415024.1 N-acetyl-alpha-D-glucosaminyl-diphospho-ditrans,octacis-undecaprenol 4-epimerase [Limisphaerales bacterium]